MLIVFPIEVVVNEQLHPPSNSPLTCIGLGPKIKVVIAQGGAVECLWHLEMVDYQMTSGRRQHA